MSGWSWNSVTTGLRNMESSLDQALGLDTSASKASNDSAATSAKKKAHNVDAYAVSLGDDLFSADWTATSEGGASSGIGISKEAAEDLAKAKQVLDKQAEKARKWIGGLWGASAGSGVEKKADKLSKPSEDAAATAAAPGRAYDGSENKAAATVEEGRRNEQSKPGEEGNGYDENEKELDDRLPAGVVELELLPDSPKADSPAEAESTPGHQRQNSSERGDNDIQTAEGDQCEETKALANGLGLAPKADKGARGILARDAEQQPTSADDREADEGVPLDSEAAAAKPEKQQSAVGMNENLSEQAGSQSEQKPTRKADDREPMNDGDETVAVQLSGKDSNDNSRSKSGSSSTENSNSSSSSVSSASSNSSNADAAVRWRLAKAEKVASKLARLLKIRELQLEKQSVATAKLREELDAAEDTAARRGKELAQARAQVAKLESAEVAGQEAAMLRRKLEETIEEGKGLSRRAVMAEKQRGQLKKEIAQLKTQREKDAAELSAQASQIETIMSRSRDVEDTGRRTTSELAQARKDVKKLDTKLIKALNQVSEAEDRADALKAELSDAKACVKESEERYRQLEKEMEGALAAHSHAQEQAQQHQEMVGEKAQSERALRTTIKELQATVSTLQEEAESSRRQHEQRVRSLREQQRQAEARNEELVSAVPAATRPLLRQIEALRETMKARADTFASAEQGLKARAKEAEAELARVRAQSSAAADRLARAEAEAAGALEEASLHRTRAEAAEKEAAAAKSRASRLAEELEGEHSRTNAIQQESTRLRARADELARKLRTQEAATKAGGDNLAARLREETERREALERELDTVRRKLKERKGASDSDGQTYVDQQSHVQPQPVQPQLSQEDFLSQSLAGFGRTTSSSPKTTTIATNSVRGVSRESGLGGGAGEAALLLQLQAKEGELAALRQRCERLEHARAGAADEMVRLTTDNAKMRSSLRLVPKLNEQSKQLRSKLEAAMQLIGEKEEELADLKEDMEEVKEVFRKQVDELLRAKASVRTSVAGSTSGESSG